MTTPPDCEAVVTAVYERRLNGETIDWEREVADHPRCADALRELRSLEAWSGRTLPPAADPPAEGQVIDGMQLTRHLGGHLGQVFAAREAATGREVAVKFVGRHEEDRIERLLELGDLRHERVVPIERVGWHAGRPHLVMPLVSGGDLAGGIARYSIAPGHCPDHDVTARLKAIARLVAAAADGVAFLHLYGVIHRDLKPGNILLGQDGPMLCDFGLLRRVSEPLDCTEPGGRVGAPAYMAPEQAEGRVASTQADVWSLGAVLYELMAGHPPFCPPGTTHDGLMAGKLHLDAPPRPSEVNRRLPPDSDLEWVCLACLHRDPARRPTAAELVRMLRRVLAGESVRATETWVEWFTRVLPLPPTGRHPPRLEWHYPERWKRCLRTEAVTSLLAHTGVFALGLLAVPGWAVWVWFLLADTVAGWVIWAPARRRVPLTPMEKLIGHWWTGADLAGLALFWAFCPALTPADPIALGRFYAAVAAVRGVIFWIEGTTWWGRLHYAGLAFFAAAAVIPFAAPCGPLVYAGLYSGVFIWLSVQRWTRPEPAG